MKFWRAATLAMVAGLLIGAAPVAASCRPPIPIERALAEADVVFVGTVVGLADADRTATIAVDEIWRGPELAVQVVVHGGPDGNMFTAVDRTWGAGGTYLVFASIAETRLTDNACSNTQPWTDALEALRPGDARPPVDGDGGGAESGVPAPLLAVIAAGAFLLIAAGFAFRRRPAPGSG